jgi:hypothetical protein
MAPERGGGVSIDLNDPLNALLRELRYHATVLPRYRAVMPHATAKLGLDEARTAVTQYGGHVEQSEVWVLPDGWELLGPWMPMQDTNP